MALERLLDVKVDWEGDNLEYDVGMAIGEIENNMTPLLQYVGAEMIEDLQRRIKMDVYRAYTPKSYPRRKDHPEFGTPLWDIKNFTTHINNDLNVAILEFDYSPDGTHKGKKKDALDYDDKYHRDDPDYAEDPLKPNPVHGDALIKRIQTGKGYDWKCSPGERPFWDNFVEEENNHGFVSRFNTYMKNNKVTKYDYTYKRASKRDLTFGAYDAIMYEDMGEVTEEDDLPF